MDENPDIKVVVTSDWIGSDFGSEAKSMIGKGADGYYHTLFSSPENEVYASPWVGPYATQSAAMVGASKEVARWEVGAVPHFRVWGRVRSQEPAVKGQGLQKQMRRGEPSIGI